MDCDREKRRNQEGKSEWIYRKIGKRMEESEKSLEGTRDKEDPRSPPERPRKF